MDGQGVFERRNVFGFGEMAFLLQRLLEQGIQILIGRGMVEVTFCDSVE
jgi:hypothetical protein